ncbi:MAG: DNA polymerase III subunit alpha [Trueperella sp.]|nr:DNA polymerase III subunit alpha [Trueperella sp.]
MAKNFAHLHAHTDYSLLDGAAKIDALVAQAAQHEQPALAITDHGYLFGTYEFYKACKNAGIKPIIGLEAYMTPGTSRFDKTRVSWGRPDQRKDDVSARGTYTHMTLLSYNNTGMNNLFRLGSLASLEGQMGKYPRIDRELLERYSEGLIGTAGCPSGEVQVRLRLGQFDEAVRAAGEMQDIFGKENYFVEVMDHDNTIEKRVRDQLLEVAQIIGAPLIATNDSHYVRPEDSRVQEALTALNSGTTLSDPDRFKFDGTGYHLRSTAEMWELFGDLDGACENTLLVAERCNVSFKTTRDGANFMPAFPVPAGENETSWFIKEVNAGLYKRYGEHIPSHVRQRADYEVDVIVKMGFPGYFLVVSDYINWAREQGIRVGPGRGSGAGSMVSYALGITQLDPIKHDLLFERFLNPERVSMPDLDIDFDDSRRDEVIEYVEKKYGEDKVSQVVTFGTIKAKQSLKDAARLLDYPYEVGDRLTKAMPPSVMGKDIPVNKIYSKDHPRYAEAGEFRSVIEGDPDNKRVFDLALGLEGIVRQWGVHACAVIMSSEPLTDTIPVMQRPADGAIITQYEYPECEELGLIKMDFLGLSNLTIIENTLQNIRDNGKEPPLIDQIALDDALTYDLLARGDTLGIFQLDSGGMRTLLRQMKVDSFDDISAVSALYRPGPMGAGSHTNYALRKNGLQEKTPIHPELAKDLEDILGNTHGLIVFQEQVMRIAQKLAGFTLGQADILRKAMGKKKVDVLQEQFKSFSDGMLANGYSQGAIKTLWDILVPFASYAFNKSHSEAYALVSYQTAYLKAHYPAEFMAALLTSKMSDKEKVATYLAECRRMGIEVLVPDVNDSRGTYSASGDQIRVGLQAVRNVGINVVNGIVQAREEKGEFTSFADFLQKIPLASCNRRAMECLIKSGAFDSMGYSRRALLSVADDAVDAIVPVKRNEAAGQFDLFSDIGQQEDDVVSVVVPELEEWTKKQKLEFEADMLGLYVSDHPLSGMESRLAAVADHTVVDLISQDEPVDGQMVTVAGIINKVITRVAKKSGRMWASIELVDLTGSIEVNVFPKTFEEYRELVVEGAVVTVKARLSVRDQNLQLHASSLEQLNIEEVTADAPINLKLSERMCTEDLVARLGETLLQYPGAAPVFLHVVQADGTAVVQLGAQYRAHPDPSLFADLKVLLGRDCVL